MTPAVFRAELELPKPPRETSPQTEELGELRWQQLLRNHELRKERRAPGEEGLREELASAELLIQELKAEFALQARGWRSRVQQLDAELLEADSACQLLRAENLQLRVEQMTQAQPDMTDFVEALASRYRENSALLHEALAESEQERGKLARRLWELEQAAVDRPQPAAVVVAQPLEASGSLRCTRLIVSAKPAELAASARCSRGCASPTARPPQQVLSAGGFHSPPAPLAQVAGRPYTVSRASSKGSTLGALLREGTDHASRGRALAQVVAEPARSQSGLLRRGPSTDLAPASLVKVEAPRRIVSVRRAPSPHPIQATANPRLACVAVNCSESRA